jgi:hypothetical protein
LLQVVEVVEALALHPLAVVAVRVDYYLLLVLLLLLAQTTQ